jgi:hypothetical protein
MGPAHLRGEHCASRMVDLARRWTLISRRLSGAKRVSSETEPAEMINGISGLTDVSSASQNVAAYAP